MSISIGIRWFTVFATVALFSCGGAGAPKSTAKTTPNVEGETGTTPAAILAGKVEPESLAPVLWNVPSWVIREVRRAGFSADELVKAYQGLLEEAEKSPNAEKTQVVHGMFIAVLGLEEHRANDACNSACLGTLTSAYSTLAHWDRSEADVLAGAILHNLEWTSVGPERANELRQFVTQLLVHADKNAASALAALLRVSEPSSSDAQYGLVQVARRLQLQGIWELSRDLYVASIEWSTPAVGPLHLAEVANACYSALDLECGNRASDRFLAGTPTEEQQNTQLEKREAAEVAVRMRDQLGLEERLQLGNALLTLYRYSDAQGVFADLAQTYPNDARGFVGLAKLAAREQSSRTVSILAEAGPLNRDREFYEIALGTWFGGPVNDLFRNENPQGKWRAIEADLPRIEKLIDGYSTYNPERSELIRNIVATGKAVLPILLRDKTEWANYQDDFYSAIEIASQTLEQSASKFPSSAEIARVRLLLATFDKDTNRAAKTIRAVSQQETAEVASMRRNVQFIVGLRKQGGRLMAELRRELATVENPSLAEKAMAADVIAAGLPQQKNKSWKQLAGRYEDLSNEGGQEFQSRLLNNLGVAKFVSGDNASASETLKLAMTMERESPVPGVNMFAISSEETTADAALSWVSERQQEGSPESRMVGAWKIAKQVKDRRQRKAEVQKALQGTTELLTPVAGQIDGARTEKSFELGLGYSSQYGLVIEVDLKTSVWLWVQP